MSSRREKVRAKRHGDRLRRSAAEAAERGELALARKLIARAIEEGPGNARYWKEQGDLQAACGERRAAEESWRHALELVPQYAEAMQRLARSLAENGESRAELELLERLRALRPEAWVGERIALLRAHGLRLAGEEQPAEALLRALERPLVACATWPWEALEPELEAHGLACVAGAFSAQDCARFLEEARHRRAEGGAGALGHGAPSPPWQAAWDEACARLALSAARARANAGAGERPAADFLPLHPLVPALERLRPDERLLLEPPPARPRFPFALHLVLACAPPAAVLELRLRDLRPGRKERARALVGRPGDLLIACRRERWVRIGGTAGLQAVECELHGLGGRVELLSC